MCIATWYVYRTFPNTYLTSRPRFPAAWVQRNQSEGEMIIANVLELLRAWRRYNSSLRELNQLGDRELSDIGISRSDIPRVAWENAHR
jgi:uncharacterized protein YjiS (DUF1127 family)